GFIQERFATDPKSLNWLFTGDRESAFDFHYEEELVEFAATNFLKLDLAFSRDGHKKVYVQDKMWHSRNDLWHWINQLKAKIYISGDAKKMAKDVQAMLEQIFITAGNLSAEEAKDLLKKLKKEK